MRLNPNFRIKEAKLDKLSMCVQVSLSSILLLFTLSILVGLAGCTAKGDKPQIQVVEPNEKKANDKKGTKSKGFDDKHREREAKRKVKTEEKNPILPPFGDTKTYRCKPKAGETWPPGCFRYERKHGEEKSPVSNDV